MIFPGSKHPVVFGIFSQDAFVKAHQECFRTLLVPAYEAVLEVVFMDSG